MLLTNSDVNIERFKFFIENSQLIKTFVVVIVAFILSRLLNKIVYDAVIFFANEKDRTKKNVLLRSYCNIISNVLKYLVYFIAVFMILVIYKVDISVMITSAGFIGIMVTYLFQDLIKDVTNGFFIVFSAPFQIGDRVKIDGFVGKVKEIDSRYVVIVDTQGNKCIINNRKIDSFVVLNREINFRKKR